MNLCECLNILELPPDLDAVTYEDVKSAHRIMVQVWHPDRYNHNEKLHARATVKMQLINEAWGQIAEHFRSGASSEIMRVKPEDTDDTDDYRLGVSEALRGFHNRRFGFF